MRATIIVPFHRNPVHLRACLQAVSGALPGVELIVAADGVNEDCEPLAGAFSATVVTVPGPSGPAVARNRAAAVARGELLVFVDADVVAAGGAIDGMCQYLEANPEVAGVFGAYTRTPPVVNFASQFKNLSHAYIHEVGNRSATTFWAGLGAVRASAFRTVGGFDERFVRPSIEDIDLGYRLVAAGHPLRLEPAFRGTHLKRWTLWDCVVTDIFARGIPWIQLILRSSSVSNDLNTSSALRYSVVLAWGMVMAVAMMPLTRWAGVAAIVMLAAVVRLNADYYRWCARERGWLFALRVVPMHLLHHLCNGVSFAVGTTLHLAQRAGINLPGVLPATAWPAATVLPCPRPRTDLS